MSDIAKMIAIAKKFGGGSSTPAPVVILPETELMTGSVEEGSNGQYVLTTPLENAPSVGGTYKMVWGGVEYTSKAVEASIEGIGAAVIALGNTDYLGLDNVENPGADMPILVVLFPDGVIEDPGDPVMYCLAVSMGITPDPPVLSIVQAEGASDGGDACGVFTVNTTYTAYNTDTGHDFGTFDRTWKELWDALEAGKLISIRAVYVGNSTPSGNLYGHVISAARNGADTLCVVSIPMTFFGGTDIRYHLSDDGNGGIAAKRATD